jgi:hypothetical protein
MGQREQPTRLLDLDLSFVGVRSGVEVGFEPRATVRVAERVLGCCDLIKKVRRVTNGNEILIRSSHYCDVDDVGGNSNGSSST